MRPFRRIGAKFVLIDRATCASPQGLSLRIIMKTKHVKLISLFSLGGLALTSWTSCDTPTGQGAGYGAAAGAIIGGAATGRVRGAALGAAAGAAAGALIGSSIEADQAASFGTPPPGGFPPAP